MKPISEMTDRELLELMLSRMDSMESRMDSMESRMDKRMDSLDARIAEIGVTQENMVLPAIQALSEGHAAILEKLEELTPKSRTEDLEDRVEALWLAVRALSRDKKAQ